MWTLKFAWTQVTQRCCPVFSSILLWMKSCVDQFLSVSHFLVACEFFWKNTIVNVTTASKQSNEFLPILKIILKQKFRILKLWFFWPRLTYHFRSDTTLPFTFGQKHTPLHFRSDTTLPFTCGQTLQSPSLDSFKCNLITHNFANNWAPGDCLQRLWFDILDTVRSTNCYGWMNE